MDVYQIVNSLESQVTLRRLYGIETEDAWNAIKVMFGVTVEDDDAVLSSAIDVWCCGWQIGWSAHISKLRHSAFACKHVAPHT